MNNGPHKQPLRRRVSSRALFLELQQGAEQLRRTDVGGQAPVVMLPGKINVSEVRFTEADLLLLCNAARNKRHFQLSFLHGDTLAIHLGLRAGCTPTQFEDRPGTATVEITQFQREGQD